MKIRNQVTVSFQVSHCFTSCFPIGLYLYFKMYFNTRYNNTANLTVSLHRRRTINLLLTLLRSQSDAIPLPGNPPSKDKPKGKYPTVVKQDSGAEVLVVQAYAYGKYLGFLQLQFDDGGKVISWTGQPILLDSSVPQGGGGACWRIT